MIFVFFIISNIYLSFSSIVFQNDAGCFKSASDRVWCIGADILPTSLSTVPIQTMNFAFGNELLLSPTTSNVLHIVSNHFITQYCTIAKTTYIIECYRFSHLTAILGCNENHFDSNPTIEINGRKALKFVMSADTGCMLEPDGLIKCGGSTTFSGSIFGVGSPITSNVMNCINYNIPALITDENISPDILTSFDIDCTKFLSGQNSCCALVQENTGPPCLDSSCLGVVYCWGFSEHYVRQRIAYVGNFPIITYEPYDIFKPIKISGSQFHRIFMGPKGVCGIDINREVHCMGTNTAGRFGRSGIDPLFDGSTINLFTRAFIGYTATYVYIHTEAACIRTPTKRIVCSGKRLVSLNGDGVSTTSTPYELIEPITKIPTLLPTHFPTIRTSTPTNVVIPIPSETITFNNNMGCFRYPNELPWCTSYTFPPQELINVILKTISVDHVSEIRYALGNSNIELIRANPIMDGYCTIHRDGLLTCYGTNRNNRFGTQSGPTYLISYDVIDVCITPNVVCFLKRTGDIFCAGNDLKGGSLLGQGDMMLFGSSTFLPVSRPPIGRKLRCDLVDTSSCCIINAYSYRIFCWGVLKFLNYQIVTSPFRISTMEFFDMSIGTSFICAINMLNVVYCMGWNSNGQFGNGNIVSSPAGVFIESYIGYSAIEIYAFDRTTCIRTVDLRTFCSGRNLIGISGGGTGNLLSPFEIQSFTYIPTKSPTISSPTLSPIVPTLYPTIQPTLEITKRPTKTPTLLPSRSPTEEPPPYITYPDVINMRANIPYLLNISTENTYQGIGITNTNLEFIHVRYPNCTSDIIQFPYEWFNQNISSICIETDVEMVRSGSIEMYVYNHKNQSNYKTIPIHILKSIDPCHSPCEVSLLEDTSIPITIELYDYLNQNRSLFYIISEWPTYGNLSVINHELLYTPYNNFYGNDYFTFYPVANNILFDIQQFDIKVVQVFDTIEIAFKSIINACINETETFIPINITDRDFEAYPIEIEFIIIKDKSDGFIKIDTSNHLIVDKCIGNTNSGVCKHIRFTGTSSHINLALQSLTFICQDEFFDTAKLKINIRPLINDGDATEDNYLDVSPAIERIVTLMGNHNSDVSDTTFISIIFELIIISIVMGIMGVLTCTLGGSIFLCAQVFKIFNIIEKLNELKPGIKYNVSKGE